MGLQISLERIGVDAVFVDLSSQVLFRLLCCVVVRVSFVLICASARPLFFLWRILLCSMLLCTKFVVIIRCRHFVGLPTGVEIARFDFYVFFCIISWHARLCIGTIALHARQ